MFVQKADEETDWEHVCHLIKTYPLATVISHSESDGMIANHVPFVLEQCPDTGKIFLKAHLNKRNSQIPLLQGDAGVLVVFQSHDSYITPSYYPKKATTHKVVPTWVFASAHIRGKANIIDDHEFVKDQLNLLTDQEEAKREEPSWSVADAPSLYIDLLQKAIIGLSIEVLDFECKYKFEQKNEDIEFAGVVSGLVKDSRSEVAKLATEKKCRYNALQCGDASIL